MWDEKIEVHSPDQFSARVLIQVWSGDGYRDIFISPDSVRELASALTDLGSGSHVILINGRRKSNPESKP